MPSIFSLRCWFQSSSHVMIIRVQNHTCTNKATLSLCACLSSLPLSLNFFHFPFIWSCCETASNVQWDSQVQCIESKCIGAQRKKVISYRSGMARNLIDCALTTTILPLDIENRLYEELLSFPAKRGKRCKRPSSRQNPVLMLKCSHKSTDAGMLYGANL